MGIKANGCKTPSSSERIKVRITIKGSFGMSENAWMKAVEIVKRELNLKEGHYLLEVGCRSAMLLPPSEVGIMVAGVDFSSSIEVAIPDLIAYVGGVTIS